PQFLLIKKILDPRVRPDDFGIPGVHFRGRFIDHVKAGIVSKLEYSHREGHFEFHRGINPFLCRAITVHAISSLVYKWYEDPVDDKACDVLSAEDRLLAKL